MCNRLVLPIGALVASLLIASVLATVSYDPYTGLGFVGKGDVQIAFSWSNAQLQSYADNNLISFLFLLQGTNTIVCRKNRPNNLPPLQKRLSDVTYSVTAAVAYEARRKPNGLLQVTGLLLKGCTASGTPTEPQCNAAIESGWYVHDVIPGTEGIIPGLYVSNGESQPIQLTWASDNEVVPPVCTGVV
jgi:hypothetical protein